MKKTMLFCIVALLAVQSVFAQQNQVLAMNTPASGKTSDDIIKADDEEMFVFEVYGTIPAPKVTFEEEHFLGEPLSAKWTAFNQNYTRAYNVSVGFSDAAVEIVKPVIYKAVNKVNKYYKKSTHNGSVNKEEAVSKLTRILDCANVLCFEDNTGKFEDALNKAKTPEEIISLFNKVTIKVL